MPKRDFVDQVVEERTRNNPRFADMVEAALEARRLLRARARCRVRRGLTQAAVAAKMETSQSAVARMERGEIDARLSTVARYAAAVGERVEWRLAEG